MRKLIILFIAAGLSVAGYLVVIVHLMRLTPPIPVPRPPGSVANVAPTKPACPVARLPGAARLGDVAWIRAGSLLVLDIGTCQQSVLVGAGAAPPVRFSEDGRWLAFGDGEVVPSTGGEVQRPFGSPVQSWEWSPTADVLAGVTRTGGVTIAGPGREPSALLPGGSGVGHLAFSPDGRRLAVDRVRRGVQVLDMATGRSRSVVDEPDPASVPRVAGWSPDGRWVLYWRGPVGKDGGPLDAVPSSGGPWVNVFDPVLPYRDFLSSCGSRIAVAAGAGQEVSLGKQILLSGPPDWAFHDLTGDFSRSWFWPSCSPDGRWVAATDTYNQKESANRTIPRALWLLAADGSSRRLLVSGTNGALEFPRWSSDGRVILVVLRSGSSWSSPGSLLLVRLDPSSGRLVKLVGPIGDLGSAPGPGGHQLWSSVSDWYPP
jgi:dipeptidyl aminopeptidase/acylaminoacyl peptidase